MNSYSNGKFRLHSGLEMPVASRWETEAARGQKSRLLKSLHVASVVTNVLVIFVKSSNLLSLRSRKHRLHLADAL